MKERFFSFKFKMDADATSDPKMVVYPNDKNQLVYKIVDNNNQEIEANLIEIQNFYIGEKRNKILLSQPVTQPVIENQFISNVDAELVRFDVILVVDTSYDPKSNPKMAFTSIMVHNRFFVDDTYTYKSISNLVEWDTTSIDKPENFMYCLAIQSLRDHYKEKKEMPRIAVIIDSDLGNIPSYNDRTKPIFGKYFLPESFYIFYASDQGEYFQSKLLKMCDKEAKKALKEYKEHSTSSI